MHNREFFYKYFSADVAEMVLTSGQLMWSAPHLFNDPFDHQISYRFPFTGQQVAEKLFQVQQDIVFGPFEPVLVEEKVLGVMSIVLRRANLQGTAKEDAIRTMREGANATIERLSAFQENLNQQLVAFLAHSRVLCVSETNSNVVMWSHYAEQHRGAVIKLKCLDELDDNFISARQVNYSDHFPEFLSLDEWVSSNFGLSVIDYGKLALNLAYTKHSDWKYEQEWRVHIPLMPYEAAGDGRSLFDKHPSAFDGLYLGCRMDNTVKQKLINLAVQRYPHMKIYSAKMAKHSFSLEFERLK